MCHGISGNGFALLSLCPTGDGFWLRMCWRWGARPLGAPFPCDRRDGWGMSNGMNPGLVPLKETTPVGSHQFTRWTVSLGVLQIGHGVDLVTIQWVWFPSRGPGSWFVFTLSTLRAPASFRGSDGFCLAFGGSRNASQKVKVYIHIYIYMYRFMA